MRCRIPAHAPWSEPLRHDAYPGRAAAALSALRNPGDNLDERAGRRNAKVYVDFDVVDRATPRQAAPGLPRRDATEFQCVLVVVHLEQASADFWLANHGAKPATVKVVDRPAYPPQVEFIGECGERRTRIDGHLYGRPHLTVAGAGLRCVGHCRTPRSTCALNETSCSSQCA